MRPDPEHRVTVKPSGGVFVEILHEALASGVPPTVGAALDLDEELALDVSEVSAPPPGGMEHELLNQLRTALPFPFSDPPQLQVASLGWLLYRFLCLRGFLRSFLRSSSANLRSSQGYFSG